MPGYCKNCGAEMQLRQSVRGMSYLVCSNNVDHRGTRPYPPPERKNG